MWETLLLALGIPPLIAFIYNYNKYYHWRKSVQGRTLMSQKIAWLVGFTHFTVTSFWDYPGWLVVQTLIIIAVVILFYVTLWGMLQKAYENRNRASAPKSHGLPEYIEKTLPRLRVRPKKR